MNDFQLTPDDPRLTAYALNELEPGERGAIEAALRAQPELRAVVADIRATADRLETVLAAEATDPAPSGAEPATPFVMLPAVESRRDGYAAINGHARSRTQRLFRFPQLYYIVGGLAAACFAVVVALREPRPMLPAAEKKTYHVIDLRPPDSMVANDSTSSAERVAMPETTVAADAIALPPPTLLEQVRQEDVASRLAPAVPKLPAPSSVASSGGQLTLTSEVRVADMSVQRRAAESPGRSESRPAGVRSGLAAASNTPVVTSGAFSGAAVTAGTGVITLEPFTVSVKSEGSGSALATFGGSVNLGGPAMAPYSPTDLYPGPRPRSPMPEIPGPTPIPTHNTEAYAFTRDNDFLTAAENPLSTFSIDVDTASYANVRRFVQGGRLPPADAVRIEELLNYFPYQYPPPAAEPRGDAAPFAATMEVAGAPWAPGHRLVRIGLKGREVAAEARPAANLVFLIDVSGSMNAPNKLPLVQEALRLLVQRLRSDDRVAIVTYAGQSGLALPSTPASRSREILDALDSLRPGGSTNGAMGIQLAYDIAKANFAGDGVNRVILCTDGDFNVGVTSQGELVRLVEEKAKSGVFLTVLGFGMGNLKDATLESLADKGNGAYGYIDTRREAEKLLVEEMTGTLVTIAKDVKIQVDFNPARVSSYRLIGYENRMLKKEDFNNDRVDAGEVGAGHTVTALYEIVPVDAARQPVIAAVDESKYQPRAARASLPPAIANELLTVRVRYKEPTGDVSRKVEFPLTDGGRGFEEASPDFKFTSAVAAFGMILRNSPHKGGATISSVIEWAAAGAYGAADARGYRRDFLDLARQVQAILGRG